MNALLRPGRQLLTMRRDDLDAVMEVERAAYPFPWTEVNFADSLQAGYLARLLRDEQGNLLGYFVAMPGVEEMHLLNLTVAPALQGRGHGRSMLDALVTDCRALCAATLWLEVRTGNLRARSLYERYGFRAIGVRRGYYPAGFGRREDALVMSLRTTAPVPGNGAAQGVDGAGNGMD